MSFASTWAPNAQRPRDITFRLTEDAVDASLLRMGADEIDLLQLSWNDFENPAFNDALYQLCELQRAGKVRHIGVIDFEEAPLKEAIGNGFQVTSNNMKCSMINLPSQGLLDLCEAQNVQLIARAVLLGGLLSDRWLLKSDKMTASLSAAEVRHFPSITQWAGGTRGRWDQFQRLLKNTREVSEKYSATIATVAIRRVLDSPAIGAAVIGSSLEETSDYSPQDLVKALEMSLDRDALDYLDRATAPRK
ncbi:NADP-dependent oxidoreductase domain-containing protein [Tribonema minus]|uniref:NADP-dependent oxidoreductase domain-containing protein n=1 Tax=Tribonema minus TaxID=303371 RepID=A0A835ZBZ1_9STRA|nr:NADP-dependent oxidoreductase domain-containing protein [Tribonema minus]